MHPITDFRDLFVCVPVRDEPSFMTTLDSVIPVGDLSALGSVFLSCDMFFASVTLCVSICVCVSRVLRTFVSVHYRHPSQANFPQNFVFSDHVPIF